MRDESGMYVGYTPCRNWMGVSRILVRECCGGKISRSAFVNCSACGEVEANETCHDYCPRIAYPEKTRRGTLNQ